VAETIMEFLLTLTSFIFLLLVVCSSFQFSTSFSAITRNRINSDDKRYHYTNKNRWSTVVLKSTILNATTDEILLRPFSRTATRDENPLLDNLFFWRHESDSIRMERRTNNNTVDLAVSSCICSLRFVIRGKPLPLQRHRTNNQRVYNPSAKPQAAFRQVVQEILTDTIIMGEYKNNEPLFSNRSERLAMKIIFRINRPKSHFSTKKKLLKSQWALISKRVDVDNLAKFVLDSLNGLLYVDDQQIFSLSATKIYDTNEEGATEVYIRSIPDSEMDRFMEDLVEETN